MTGLMRDNEEGEGPDADAEPELVLPLASAASAASAKSSQQSATRFPSPPKQAMAFRNAAARRPTAPPSATSLLQALSE